MGAPRFAVAQRRGSHLARHVDRHLDRLLLAEVDEADAEHPGMPRRPAALAWPPGVGTVWRGYPGVAGKTTF